MWCFLIHTPRTGTIYAADGTAEYTGPLLSSVADTGATPWHNALPDSPKPSDYFSTWSQSLPNQVDAQGNLFDRAIQGASASGVGSMTDTYKDDSGRTVETLFDDGSFTQTAYSQGDAPVASIPAPLGWIAGLGGASATALTPPAGLTIPIGGSETVSVAQRKLGDAAVVTYDVYDAAGNLVDVYEPPVKDALSGNTPTSPHTHYAYDASGNETLQVEAAQEGAYATWLAGPQTTPFTGGTRFAYDEDGHEVSRTLPDGEAESYTYDAHGRQATHKDFDGNVATDAYYTTYGSGAYAGALESVSYAAPTGSSKTSATVTYTYDALGRVQTTSDASGTTTDSYDNDGNLIEESTPEGDIHYVFDPATGLHTETYTANTDTAYGYNTLGQLQTVTVKKLNGVSLGTSPLVTQYAYDDAGNKKTETLPDGELTTFTYDGLNRLKTVTEVQGTRTLFSETLILDDAGRRTSATETQLQPDGSIVTGTYSWGYDDDSRLTSEGLTATSNATSGSADALAAAAEDYTDAYSYDLNGNRITDTHVGPGNGASVTTTNTFDGDDQLKTSTANGVLTQYGYDDNGSQTSVTTSGTLTASYTYDVRNKMVGYQSGGTTASYVYDDAGNRVAETVNGVTTYYLTDTQNPTGYVQPIEAKSSATAAPTTTYILGDRALAQADATGNVKYLLIDGHGSTQQITNASGVVTSALTYTAYGSALNFDPATAGTMYLFGGDSLYDPASGTYMHGDGTRDRDGFRFIQADTQGNGSSSDLLCLYPLALQMIMML